MGSWEDCQANGRQFDENGRFEGGSVPDRAGIKGLTEDPETTESPRGPPIREPVNAATGRKEGRVSPIFDTMGSVIWAIVRSLRRGEVVTYGDISRKVCGNAEVGRAVGAAIRAKAREPRFPWWHVVNRKPHPTRTM